MTGLTLRQVLSKSCSENKAQAQGEPLSYRVAVNLEPSRLELDTDKGETPC